MDLGESEMAFEGRRLSVVGEFVDTSDSEVEDMLRALGAVGHSCIKRHDQQCVLVKAPSVAKLGRKGVRVENDVIVAMR